MGKIAVALCLLLLSCSGAGDDLGTDPSSGGSGGSGGAGASGGLGSGGTGGDGSGGSVASGGSGGSGGSGEGEAGSQPVLSCDGLRTDYEVPPGHCMIIEGWHASGRITYPGCMSEAELSCSQIGTFRSTVESHWDVSVTRYVHAPLDDCGSGWTARILPGHCPED